MIALVLAEGPMGLTPLLFTILTSGVFIAATACMVVAYLLAALLVAALVSVPRQWGRALKLGRLRAVGGLLASWLAFSSWVFAERVGLEFAVLPSLGGFLAIQTWLWWMLVKSLAPELPAIPRTGVLRGTFVLILALMLPVEFVYAFVASFFGSTIAL